MKSYTRIRARIDLDAIEYNIEKMKEAASYLIGTHGFKSFCANRHMKKSTVRTIFDISIEEQDGILRIHYHGDGFLYNMVRAMVGTCVYAAEGKFPPEAVSDILEGRCRTAAGPTAPPGGLYMTKLWYEEDVL